MVKKGAKKPFFCNGIASHLKTLAKFSPRLQEFFTQATSYARTKRSSPKNSTKIHLVCGLP